MSALAALLSTPSRIAIAVLAAALMACNIGWWVHAQVIGHRLDAEAVALSASRATSASLTAQLDMCTAHSRELAEANIYSQQAIDQLKQALADAQGETQRLQAEGRKAIADAQAQAEDADRALKTFIDRYAAQVKNPDCAGALNTLEHACPALKGY